MATDPNWLYSTIAQSTAAIVAIIGGFILSNILTLSTEKRSLRNQKQDKESQLKILTREKRQLLDELEPNEVSSFIDSIKDDLIESEDLPSLENIMQKYQETNSFNIEILKLNYEKILKQISEARNFIRKLLLDSDVIQVWRFDEWVKKKYLDISPYDYEILEKEFHKKEDQIQNSLSEIDKITMSTRNRISMRLPYITPISVQQDLERMREKIKKDSYEILSLENEIINLNFRITNFSYPPNLGLGIFVLCFLTFFSIFMPVITISEEWFFLWVKLLTITLFSIGIIGVFIYIVFQIHTLTRR
jgi:hypothetical protein